MDNSNTPRVPVVYSYENSSTNSVTQVDISVILKSQTEHTQSPRTSSDPHLNSNPSDLQIPKGSSALTRPHAARRTSTITWQETLETNSISVPSLLKKEVATSKAGRVKPVVEKFASWFKGSPEDLEEIYEAKEDDRKWKRRVKKWKRERRESEDGRLVSFDDEGHTGLVSRLRRRFFCAYMDG